MSFARRAGLQLVSLGAIACGFTVATRVLRRWRADYRVFIMEYHDVSTTGAESEGTISQERFRRHIRFLKRRYRLATLSEAARQLRSEAGLSEDLVVVTFDDGYAGNFEAAWPVLAAERVPATIFLTTGFLDGSELWFDLVRRALPAILNLETELPDEIGKVLTTRTRRRGNSPESALEQLKRLPAAERERLLERIRSLDLRLGPPARPLSWDQVQKLHRAGIEIGAHTVNHPVLPSLPVEIQEHEIRESQQRIAEAIGELPASFAFPNGDYDAGTLEIIERLGFAAACTTRRGSNLPGCDPLTLRRIGVGSDPPWVLAARLSGLFNEELRRLLP